MAALRITLESLQGNKSLQEPPSWKRFLPPGFRSNNPINWFAAFAGYAFLFWICCILEVENAGMIELIINRVAITVISLAIVLFSGNYLDIQSKIVFTKSKNAVIRILGIVAVDIAILFLGIMVMSIVVSILI